MKDIFSYKFLSIVLVLGLITFSFAQTNISTTTLNQGALQTERWQNTQAVQYQEQNTQSLANIVGSIIEKEFLIILFVVVIIGIVWLLVKRRGKREDNAQNTYTVRMEYKWQR